MRDHHSVNSNSITVLGKDHQLTVKDNREMEKGTFAPSKAFIPEVTSQL